MKSRMMIGLLVIAIAAAVIGGGTMAWFQDTGNAGEAVFEAGTLRIGVSDGLTIFAGIPDVGIDNMNPGDLYDEIVIVIENTGTKNLIWFGNWTAELEDDNMTDALLDGIYIHTMKMEFLDANDTTFENGGSWNEPTDQFITEGVGSGSYPGWYDTLAGMGDFPVVQLRHWLDNNGMGTTPNEHVGALKPGYSYRLTVTFGFYSGADNAYQGDVASPIKVGFEVNSTQIVADAIDAIVTTDGGGEYWENWGLGQIANQN